MTIIYGIFVDESNLKAIAYLEQHGISAPTQAQIDEAEHYLKIISRVPLHTSNETNAGAKVHCWQS